mmetsp:Transcript_27194/g.85585  ORF Transcript_27194/g.85585 Transcript_27194/m.85585 type:complete len:80 (+) Transcript_27194:133-372(+)
MASFQDSPHHSSHWGGEGTKVLVTGGGGFIGAYLGKALKELGYYVVIAVTPPLCYPIRSTNPSLLAANETSRLTFIAPS